MKLLSLFLLPGLLLAAVWPDDLGQFKRAAVQPGAAADRALWREYGFQEAETAPYSGSGGQFRATSYRFQDSTGALAAFQSQRPPGAKPSALGQLAVQTDDSAILAHGNYLLRFEGYKPQPAELATVLSMLPKLEQSSLPSLIEFLPAENLEPNSSRYIIGPAGLERFEPRIPPSTAAFHMGAEAQAGVYRTGAGEVKLLIFSYPTPQIAMERAAAYQAISGAMVKRSGPLLAVTVGPADADAAEKLLSQVRYEATITWSEYVPTQRDNIGDLVINAFILTGVILVFFLVAGLLFGGWRALLRTLRKGDEPEAIIALHISDRR